MCPICQKLGIRLIPVQFAGEGISEEDREKISQGIADVMVDGAVRTIVTEADTNGFVHCKAYKDEHGNAVPVHQGHCTGAFEGTEACRYWIAGNPHSASVGWCSYRDESDKLREIQAERARIARQQAYINRCLGR